MDTMIGITIGNFEVLKVIGRGGMSSVYLAMDKDLERNVALKIPHERFIDKSAFAKRFRREAKAMARLRHPNIVQIYSVGAHGEIPFFAMEHINGGNLENVIRTEGALSLGVSIKYVTQIARAIDYAHNKGVIHRDIKPANILVDPSGRLLVTDFGVSKLLSEQATQETVGFIGTPQYMSPEQCGQGTLDHRTDIYSLGAVLFEMLTGQAAFSSDSPAEIIKKQLFDMPEFPAEFREKIPDKLQAVISKMLAKDPDQRYSNIRAFLRDIERLDRESDALTHPLSSSTAETVTLGKSAQLPARKAGRKRRKLRVPALAFACALVVCAAAFLMAFKKSDRLGADVASLAQALRSKEKTGTLVVEPARDPAPEEPAPAGLFPEDLPGPTLTEPVDTKTAEAEPEPPVSMEPGPIVAAAVAEPEFEWARMVINSKPAGADVFVDDEPLGVTPLTLSEVMPGIHQLAMSLDGYPAYTMETTVDHAAALEISHDFEAAKEALIPKGSLTIDSEPSGAMVYIDGAKKGPTPLDLPDLPAADYIVTLEMENYQPIRKKIALLPDEKLRISLNLMEKPRHGSLAVRSRPEGADVLLDGVFKGITPLKLAKVPVGEYSVMLRKNGYKPHRQDFTCEEESAGVIEASLDMTPKFAATESMIAGDRYAKRGELKRAATAYDRAISLDSESTVYRRKRNKIRQTMTKREIRDLLSSYKFAYDSEDAELLASLLEAGSFSSDQVANARSLFREFDNIVMALESPKVSFKGPGEASIELHLSINADFAETGASAELLNARQKLMLRRSPEVGWKICAIE